MYHVTRKPSLAPLEDFQMPEFTKDSPAYTQMTLEHGRSVLRRGQAFKANKMEFWNHKVPQLYLEQLRQELHLLDVQSRHPSVCSGDSSGGLPRGSSPAMDETSHHPSGHWALVTACVALSGLVLLLTVCYCQVRRQVNRMIRQSGLSNG